LGEVVKLGRLLVRTGFVAGGFAAMLVLLLGGTPGRARAFSEPRSYAADPISGGGGNRWFTGSPAEGFSCSDCHSGAKGARLYIEGLPPKEYQPGAIYDVRVSWPEFAAQFAQLKAAPVPGLNPPSMGMLAELVADSGQGAGTIEIADSLEAMPAERCGGARLGTELYIVKQGLKTVKAQTKCTAAAQGDRCVLAVRACGSQELRFRWTAPSTPQGAIWFAAGFVSSEHLSGQPDGDGVTETTRVLLPQGAGAPYEAALTGSGCSAAASRGAHAADAGGAGAAAWCVLSFAAMWRVRAARRRARAVKP
jgi:hypothetical protein